MNIPTLQALVDAPGPFASIYIEEPHTTADAAKQRELNARLVRDELLHKGAPDALGQMIEERLREVRAPHTFRSRAIIANRDDVLIDAALGYPVTGPTIRFSRLPYVLPLVTESSGSAGHITVLVDSVGVDIAVVGPDGDTWENPTEQGSSDRAQVHKVRSGGTGAYHDTPANAAEAHQSNMSELASAVADVAGRYPALPLFVGGEVQSRGRLIGQLPEDATARAIELESGSRSQGWREEELDREREQHLLARHAELMAQVAQQFEHAAAGPELLGVHGVDAVTGALRESNVETLLVAEPTDADVWSGRSPNLVAGRRADIDMGGDEIIACRADEALPYAALATGADIVTMDPRLTLHQGVGAVLRHTTAAVSV